VKPKTPWSQIFLHRTNWFRQRSPGHREKFCQVLTPTSPREDIGAFGVPTLAATWCNTVTKLAKNWKGKHKAWIRYVLVGATWNTCTKSSRKLWILTSYHQTTIPAEICALSSDISRWMSLPGTKMQHYGHSLSCCRTIPSFLILTYSDMLIQYSVKLNQRLKTQRTLARSTARKCEQISTCVFLQHHKNQTVGTCNRSLTEKLKTPWIVFADFRAISVFTLLTCGNMEFPTIEQVFEFM